MPEVEIADDPDLLPEEKEIMVRWARCDDRLTVHAEQSTAVKWLLEHPEFQQDRRRVKNGVVHAVSGTLPVGVLNLSGTSRQSSYTSDVLGVLPDDE